MPHIARILVRMLMVLLPLLGSVWAQDTPDTRPGCDACRFRIDSLEQPFDLRGNWLFTREDRPENKNITLDTRDWKLLKTPGPWRYAYGDGKNFSVGWHRATLEFAPHLVGQDVVLLFDSYISRTQVYLDGQLVFERPKDVNLGQNFYLQTIPLRFTVTQPRHTVAIRVDTPLMQGLFQLPFELRRYVADAPDVGWHQLRGRELRLISAVVGIAFALFFLLVYSKARYGIYLHAALTSLFGSLYPLATTDVVLRYVTPETAYILSYFGLNFAYFLYRFMQYLYQPMPRTSRVLGALLLLSNLGLLAMLLAPDLDWLQPLRTLHFLLAFTLGLCTMYAAVQGFRRHRSGTGILLAGFLLFFCCGLNDLLLALGLISSYFLIPVGLFVTLITMLYVTSNIFANTFSDNQKLLTRLQTEQERTAVMLRMVPDSFTVTRLEDGLFVSANDGFTRLTGWTAEDAIGHSTTELGLWPPHARPHYVAQLKEQGSLDNADFTFIHKDGHPVQTQVSATTFLIDGVPHIAMSTRNVGESRKQEKALQRSYAMLVKIQNNVGMGLWQWLPETDDILCSQSALDQFHYWPTNHDTLPPGFAARFKGTKMIDFVHPDDRERFLRNVSQVLQDQQIRTERYHTIRDDGAQRLMLIELNAETEDEGEVRSIYGFTKDITEEQRVQEELEQHRNHLEKLVGQRTEELRAAIATAEAAQHAAETANRMKSEFLAMISHEMRTPLGGVIGMLKLGLKDTWLTEDTRGKFSVGLANAESLLQIINDILDYSKLEAGKMSLECIDFDLPAVVQDSHSILEERAEAKGLSLIMEVQANLPRWWQGDPVRLRQVLLNLMGNAIKFTDAGEICVTLVQGDDGWLEFTVRDTGIGIAAEALPRLFQKFEQADISTTRKFGGTGLGLAICKSIIEVMGGTIEVQSMLGVGTTFRFRMPLPQGQSPEAVPTTASSQHTHRLSILCAEDGKTNQLIVREFIESMGHSIDIAEDGALALAALGERDYDLVLMDSRMPNMDGLSALRFIRQGAFGVRDSAIPVVALTANVGAEERERFFAAGANGFLGKPIDEEALHTELARIIELLHARGKVLAPQTTPDAIPEHITVLDTLFGLDTGVLEAPSPTVSPPKTGNAGQAGFSRKTSQAMQAAFLGEAPRLLGVMQEALATQDAQAIALAAHSLKGSAGYFGARELQELCRQIEETADAGTLDGLATMLEDLTQAVAAAVVRLGAGS